MVASVVLMSGCPDCVEAEPIIDEALEGIDDNVTLVRCDVVRAEYKGNPDYPYRTHPKLLVKSVPSLYYWVGEGPVASSDAITSVRRVLALMTTA